MYSIPLLKKEIVINTNISIYKKQEDKYYNVLKNQIEEEIILENSWILKENQNKISGIYYQYLDKFKMLSISIIQMNIVSENKEWDIFETYYIDSDRIIYKELSDDLYELKEIENFFNYIATYNNIEIAFDYNKKKLENNNHNKTIFQNYYKMLPPYITKSYTTPSWKKIETLEDICFCFIENKQYNTLLKLEPEKEIKIEVLETAEKEINILKSESWSYQNLENIKYVSIEMNNTNKMVIRIFIFENKNTIYEIERIYLQNNELLFCNRTNKGTWVQNQEQTAWMHEFSYVTIEDSILENKNQITDHIKELQNIYPEEKYLKEINNSDNIMQEDEQQTVETEEPFPFHSVLKERAVDYLNIIILNENLLKRSLKFHFLLCLLKYPVSHIFLEIEMEIILKKIIKHHFSDVIFEDIFGEINRKENCAINQIGLNNYQKISLLKYLQQDNLKNKKIIRHIKNAIEIPLKQLNDQEFDLLVHILNQKNGSAAEELSKICKTIIKNESFEFLEKLSPIISNISDMNLYHYNTFLERAFEIKEIKKIDLFQKYESYGPLNNEVNEIFEKMDFLKPDNSIAYQKEKSSASSFFYEDEQFIIRYPNNKNELFFEYNEIENSIEKENLKNKIYLLLRCKNNPYLPYKVIILTKERILLNIISTKNHFKKTPEDGNFLQAWKNVCKLKEPVQNKKILRKEYFKNLFRL